MIVRMESGKMMFSKRTMTIGFAMLLSMHAMGVKGESGATVENEVKPLFVPNPVVLEKRPVTRLAIGAKAPEFRLPGVDGRWHALSDYEEAKVLVIIFTCNHCPAAQKFEQDFNAIAREYASKGVALIAISSSSPLGVEDWELGWCDIGDDYESMKVRAKEKKFLFPYLYDGDDQRASLAYGALTTPHLFVFDEEKILRYTGRPGKRPTKRNKLTGRADDLRSAIDDLLSGRKIAKPVTVNIGCSTKWSWKHGHLSEPWNDWRKTEVTLQEIDDAGIKDLLKNDSNRLRLVNVWATWCTSCLGEYTNFVKLHGIYHPRELYDAKSGFEFVSLCVDSLEKKEVAKNLLDRFQSRVKNYIYDEERVEQLAELLDPQWSGALPYTVLIAPGGEVLYRYQGAVDFAELRKLIIEYPTMGRLQ